MKLKIMLAAALVSTAVDAAAPVFTGRFLGTGRACYGSLVIRDKTMSWLTTFSQCRSLPYEVIERGDDGAGPSRLTFRLTRSVPACKYQVVSLTHNGVDEGIGWEVTGYGNDRSFAADRAGGYKANTPDMMSCYLIRDPGVEPARTPR
jgi:hypothetical protein